MRFPRQNAEELRTEAEAQGLTPEKDARLDTILERAYKILENSEYIKDPKKAKQAMLFVILANKLSNTFEIDIDITQGIDRVTVLLHLYCALYDGDLLRMFKILIRMCDEIDALILPDEPTDFTLALTLITHKRVPKKAETSD